GRPGAAPGRPHRRDGAPDLRARRKRALTPAQKEEGRARPQGRARPFAVEAISDAGCSGSSPATRRTTNRCRPGAADPGCAALAALPLLVALLLLFVPVLLRHVYS